MRSDLDMIVHKFPDLTEITVIPVSDVHLGALEHNTAAWNAFCKEVMEQPNTKILLVGDLINNSTRTSVANPFDEVMRPREQKTRMVEMLKPLADDGRILCAVSGNHERRSMKDSDVDLTYDIMAKLDIENVYRENIAFVKISLGRRVSEKKPKCTFLFAVTHGAGGGIYTGAAVNRNERFGNVLDGVDCIVVGHTHKGTVSRPSKIVVDARNEKVYLRSYTVVSAESWMSYGGYAAQKMLLPSESANPQKLILSGNPHNKQIEVRW